MIFSLVLSAFLVLLFSVFFVYTLTLLPRNKGRFKYGGVYSARSSYYPFKYALLLTLLKVRKWYKGRDNVGPLKMYDNEERRRLRAMESLHSVVETDAIDSVYFYCTGYIVPEEKDGSDSRHSIDIIVRIARRQERINEHWIMIRRDSEPLLVHQNAPETSTANCSASSWSTLSGANIWCDRPNEKWTVKYNGWLKNPDVAGQKMHINLKMSFTAFSNVFDSHKDTSMELAADAIARESWSRDFFKDLKNLQEAKQTHYEQWGGYTGKIAFGRQNFFVLHQCKGYRDHSFGIRNWSQYQRYGTFFGYFENGSCLSLGSVSCRKTLTHIRHGYYVTPYGEITPVTQHNFDLWTYFLVSPPRSQVPIEFFAGGERFELLCTETANTTFNLNEGTTNIYERFVNFKLNGHSGRGVGEYCASDAVPIRRYAPITSINVLGHHNFNGRDQLCVSIRDEQCRDKALAGGKGCHLGDLCKISKGYSEIVVPDGFVVTTVAFEQFLQANTNIRNTIRALIKDFTDSGDSVLEIMCHELQSQVVTGGVPESLRAEIVSQMQVDIGPGWDREKLAVRSSAEEEDSATASGAGQMDTFLGVQGEDQIMMSIKKCWASQYSHQAVVYKRRNGQVVDSKMAVVIMRMVPSQTSGVLFTANPLDGDMTRMIVDASFGLGEALVSGKCTPDHFVVERGLDGQLRIEDKVIGSKEVRIDMMEGRGLQEENVENSNAQSLPDEEVLKLAKIGSLIEQCYGQPSDIEWAISDGQTYLLQVRPITNLKGLSDEELIHEFDSSLSMDQECLTTCNIGEMMPMAVTPLTLSVFGAAVDVVLQTIPLRMGVYHRYLNPRRFLPSFCNHLFINLQSLLVVNMKSSILSDNKMTFLFLIGRPLERPNREDLIKFGGSTTLLRGLINSAISLKNRFQGTKKTMEWENKLDSGYRVPRRLSVKAQMEAIVVQMDDYYKCWLDTVHNTSQSAIWTMIIMKMLGGKNDWNQDLYSKMATLLSTCHDVFSADVPTALKGIATAIGLDPQFKETFMKTSMEDCLRWLSSPASKEVGDLYHHFLRRHGHRCIREAEFREKSWRSDQGKLIIALRKIVSHPNEGSLRKEELSVEDALNKVQLKVNLVKRVILKWLIGKARRGVGLREWGKSLSIQMCEVFKSAYLDLGSLMVQEGLLPDQDLVYFFTHDELVTALVDRQEPISQCVGRALRRRKVLADQMKIMMPEVSYGPPDPENEQREVRSTGDPSNRLSGVPVSVGKVRGPARVVRTLEEAAGIQVGEILVVPYTDVGWTPYFPLLSGLVTEKGGILSHGAVVAREYGLPCIVGCRGATTMFATGDLVLLNASRGTLERCQETR